MGDSVVERVAQLEEAVRRAVDTLGRLRAANRELKRRAREDLLAPVGELPHLARALPILGAEPAEGIDGAADRFLELCHTLDDRVAHQALLPIRRFSA